MSASIPAPGGRRALRSRTALRTAGLAAAAAALVFSVLLSIAVGARSIPLGEVLGVLFDPSASRNSEVVHDLRLPRTVLGLVVGAALAVAGALMQSLTRNPIADPGILGVNAGAATAVVIAIAVLGVTAPAGYVWFAFAGAAAISALVYGLGAGGQAGASPARLALAGVAITAALSAFIAAMVLLHPQAFEQFRHWEVGAIGGRDWSVTLQMGAFVLAGLVLAGLLARSLDALALGEDTGRALGAHPRRIQAAGLLAVAVLAGAATAAAGPIAFIGLTIPHVARAVVGPDQRWITAYCVLLGPALVLVADVVGRLIDPPAEIPVAVVTAFVGAPFFIALVSRRRIARL